MNKTLIILFAIFSNALSQKYFSDDSTYFKTNEDGHTFEIIITKTVFDTSKHDLSKIKNNIIDGKNAWGTDCETPKYEISSINLSIDAKKVLIHPDIYNFCYNPNLNEPYFYAYWGNDYKSIFVFMNSGDGAGGYTIGWNFRDNGDHTYMIPRYDDFMFQSQW